jgi:hypothetical protein
LRHIRAAVIRFPTAGFPFGLNAATNSKPI